MIVELRTYTLQLGKVPDYFALYEAEGLEVQRRILGNLVGYYACESGPLNQIIHMWAYDSMEDRAKRRAALFQDPDWLAYIEKATPLILDQHTRFLSPAPFFQPVR